MVSVKDRHLIYLSNKMDEYMAEYGDENIRKYISFYEEISFPCLKEIFSIFHYQFNSLFKYMNGRLSYGHYTADESRELIYLNEELKTIQSNLKDTKYEFNVSTYYKRTLNECEGFLRSSGGSSIPESFQRINIVEAEPIFTIKSNTSIVREGGIFSFSTKTIGSGSYASVHKYKDDYYNRFFVIKKANKNLSKDEYERFKIEFDLMKQLNSPYVIEVYNFDEVNRQYIMEYADETLDTYISKNNNKLENRERINLVRQILRAFTYIHSKGVLHRDVSTTNILLKKYEELNIIKVSDFGLVKLKDSVLTRKSTDIKGFLNDPKLEVMGFNHYEIRHETYALTRLVYFVMTGKIRLESFQSEKFKVFIEKGISDNINYRYKNIEELQSAFNNVVNTL
ncbi:protein kinase domain-containing protein [Bacillus pseudomycoides]|uniref:protein kinase domain-containing protein n=1 Tax=Bacillus pseudomycoides TaxID=64104 RepID=UPI00032FF4E6|nr:protein kinase [Bacillus pseudomycoides]EOQ08928.1 hypothetical protein KOY_05229 [Bacillus cereus VDM021]OOG89824.1 hypothetical protein BTH41_04695 [Bacillus mycoides]PEL19028.1 serine/threonine protein kinase [Bacillus pseudomycoides]